MTDLEEIVDYIDAFHMTYGYAPTVREVGAAVGLRSPSTIHHHLTTLYSQGRIEWEPTISRTLRVATPGSAVGVQSTQRTR